MKLETLHIRRQYGEDTYRATVKFSNNSGETELNLSEELTAGVLHVVGEALERAAHDVAISMLGSVRESLPTRLISPSEVRMERLGDGDETLQPEDEEPPF